MDYKKQWNTNGKFQVYYKLFIFNVSPKTGIKNAFESIIFIWQLKAIGKYRTFNFNHLIFELLIIQRQIVKLHYLSL